MKSQIIETESSLFEYFKRTMYALMVIVVALAIPLLSYLALSYNGTNDKKINTEKAENFASNAAKGNTVKM